jgi:RHS repeat-associated protein
LTFRLTETTLHDGADTVYAYNNLGNLASVTDPTNNLTSYTYDYLHRLKTESITIDSVPRTKTYWYDAVGQMIKKEDRLGQITRYDFDNLGRVYQERWKTDTGTTVRTIGYQFDNLGRLTGVSEVDGSSTSVGAAYGYTYDNLGRVTQTVHDIAGLTPDVTFDQTFNALGSRTQLAATIGTTADFVNDYSYDALGRMARVMQQDQSGGNAVADKRVNFDYSPTGQFSQIRRYADLLESESVAQTDFSYDAIGRLTDLSHNGGGLASSIDYTLNYDDHLLDTVTYVGKTLDYAYDTVDQLTTVDYTGTGTPTDESHSYDDSGNRTNTGYTTGDHNRLTADGTYTYQYDANGNRTVRTKVSDGTLTEYGWDHRNRLTSVTFKTSGGTVTKAVQYEYDAYNRLITKTVDSDANGTTDATYHWIYDGNQPVLQFDGNAVSDLSHRYLWGPAVDQLLADETAGNGGPEDILWPLTDWQGSVRHLATYNAATDTTTIENEKFYDAYGNVTSETNSSVDTLFAYTGRFFDEDTGLQWNLNRWYDPKVGRFVSEDPIGFLSGDPNWYRYVENSPGDSVDPDGLAKNRLPDPKKGKWIEGTPGNGVFVYTAYPDQPLTYKGDMPVFSGDDLFKTRDGRPPEVEVEMDTRSTVSQGGRRVADMARADKEMKKRYGNEWTRPTGYTWHHKKLNGTKCEMQLVKTRTHGRASHTGPRAILDGMLRLPSRSANPRKTRGGFVASPWAVFPRLGNLQMPRLKGAARGAAPVAGPIAADFAIGIVDDMSDGAFVNLLDNTLGSGPGDTCTNIGRLLGPDFRRHWSYIFHEESALHEGRYKEEMKEQYRRERARRAQDEAIQRYRDMDK